MRKIMIGLAGAGLLALTLGGQAPAQERALRRITAGPAAPLNKSMTQAQARKLCAQQMRGTRESRSAIRQKMAICQRKYMEGI
jgi:hypothetical protein